MKVYRFGIKTCFGICIVSLASCVFAFALINYINIDQDVCVYNLVYDICLGIFASSFVVFITYLGAYFIEKKKIIGLVEYFCGEYISELSNLVPLLIEIFDDRTCKYNWEEIKPKIEQNPEVHSITLNLLRIHNERLLAVEGYFPMQKRNKNNLQIHHLICMLAKVNGAVQYCDLAYRLSNNIVYRMEKEDVGFSEEELKKQADIILQTNNNCEYQRFLEIYKAVQDRSPSASVYSSNWEGKCS